MNAQTNDTSLSMIDCGIRSLKEVPLKRSLVSINLHSNKIVKIENLVYLQSLIHLDLSSNQIKQIAGLNGLFSLKSLNLSCNFITSIENLTDLKHLTWLNLSYNKIQHLNGLSDLWGVDYSIETILLNGNFVNSIEETTYYLGGLKNLKHLNLSDNKFMKTVEYRPVLFSHIKSLVSVDGKDKLGKLFKIPAPVISNEFTEWNNLSSVASSHAKPFEDLFTKSESFKKKHIKIETPTDSTPKLDAIETKIHQLLTIRDKIKVNNQDIDYDENEDEIDVRLPVQKKSCKKPIGILKPSTVELSKSDSKLDKSSESSADIYSAKHANDLIALMKTQLESYKQSQDLNLKLISDLRLNMDTLKEEKDKCLADKECHIKGLNEQIKMLNLELETLKKTLELNKNKLETENLSFLKIEKEKLKESLDSAKKQMKKYYAIEIEKLNQSNETVKRQNLDKIESLEKSLRSLEDEFRSALIIESNRYNELFSKYEASNKECNDLKTNCLTLEMNDERNKSLIKELNDLIKEQKDRLQILVKIRKETSGDIQKRDVKLTEAVSDCTKFQSQNELLKKAKTSLEAKLKTLAHEYSLIKKERETWTTKLNDQKTFLMQENNRLSIENQSLFAELDLLRKSHEKELDSVKIKTKIIEDQTETIKKLKNAMLERDDLLKQNRDETLNVQKSLEKQLNEEMNLCNELQLKFEKANQRKEELKLELQDVKQNLEETKQSYEELTEKWKHKTELITDLDFKVRKMKENYETKEKELIKEKNSLLEENNKLNERLHKVDDDFRLQYDVEKREHFKLIEKTKRDYEIKLIQSDDRVKEIEQEMRQLLFESANKKKFYEDKIKSFSSMFSQIQSDLIES